MAPSDNTPVSDTRKDEGNRGRVRPLGLDPFLGGV